MQTGHVAAVRGSEQWWARFERWGPYALLGTGLLISAATTEVIPMDRVAWTAVALLVLAALGLQVWWGRVGGGPSIAGTCYFFARWAIAFVLRIPNAPRPVEDPGR